ncbi:acetoacetate--CoA ligase [Amycolatopsis tucumanensis]|uniref:Acetoacetate--CoA ligase n=1 Tax=Amycolatopsis tucumanensis TaxID=401106 RepID=A0ABP7JV80_9PSEU|nr:acetoacetate--CoA ligase [Amycolatopsis tucumanensis]MCF6427202.1 acetoacetate--CoA ligase [Amycolatopsis tucumanensis]
MEHRGVVVSAEVWTPTAQAAAEATITAFARFAGRRGGPPPGASYEELWRWSVDDTAEFWNAVAEFCEVAWDTPPDAVTDGAPMPETRWFPGGRLNYAAQVFRTPRTGAAVVGHDETGISQTLTWAELEAQVSGLAATLAGLGVRAGDRVAGYLPDRPEAIVAFLATASVGAVWAGCGTDLAGDAARARLAQLDPAVLIAASGHHHRGQWIDRTTDVRKLREGLPTLRATVLVGDGHPTDGTTLTWAQAVSPPAQRVEPVPVPAEHPLWVLFTSGTTGPPKGIVHSHAGVVVEHLKTLSLHLEVRPGDQFFWYTTLNWMMWNLRVGGLLRGATVHCFDGAPTVRALWQVAERGGVTHLGLSPGYLSASRDAGLHPAADFDLPALRVVGCTGSVLTAPLHQWAAEELGREVLVGSTTGGTDVVSGFAGFALTVPIRAGEIAVRCLGVDLQAWSADRKPLTDAVGELVVTSPMPSMPLRFWNDPDGSRYRGAYFEEFPGVWRHGDWVTVTGRGSVIVHGRSDATLNRHGIRMGSADICQAAEDLPEVGEALVVGIEEPDGGYWMPMFVTLSGGRHLDEELAAAVRAAVRDRVSPRHVPDEVIEAPGIPHTRTGKKLEVPVKNILRGFTGTVQKDAVDRPELLEFYRQTGENRRRTR